MKTELPTQKSKWSIYYEKMEDPSWFDMMISVMYHWRYFKEILDKKPQSVLEVGTGRGLHAIFLSYFIPLVIGIDTEESLLKKAYKLSRNLRGRVRFLKMDAFHLGFRDQKFSVSCSQGFFEHFTNSDIKSLVREQTRVAKSVIFSIPSHNYPERNIGNERLLSIQEIFEILNNYYMKGYYYGWNVNTKNGFLGNLKLSKLSKILLTPRRAQICATITKLRT